VEELFAQVNPDETGDGERQPAVEGEGLVSAPSGGHVDETVGRLDNQIGELGGVGLGNAGEAGIAGRFQDGPVASAVEARRRTGTVGRQS
jgi:hypothetical protein